MKKAAALSILICLLLLGSRAGASAKKLSQQEIQSLFVQANDAFRKANSLSEAPEKAEKLYEKAILSYERIINDGGIRNARLYYNLGNAYFLNEQLGRAILNYRRAEQLDGSDRNIHKNLAFARSKIIDTVGVGAEKRVLKTLFFWHYDFSLWTRYLMACVSFGVLCVGLTVMIWLGRGAAAVTGVVISLVLTVCFLVSVAVEAADDTREAVILAEEVVARQADWADAAPSFKEPLHEGLEFEVIEHRRGWFHIRLPDGSDGWIPDDAAEVI